MSFRCEADGAKSGIDEKVEVYVCDLAIGWPYDVDALTREGRKTEKGTGGMNPEGSPKVILRCE